MGAGKSTGISGRQQSHNYRGRWHELFRQGQPVCKFETAAQPASIATVRHSAPLGSFRYFDY